MVTHLTTNPPVRCLNMAERTGCLVPIVLWSYVKVVVQSVQYILADESSIPNSEQVFFTQQTEHVDSINILPRISHLSVS
jgi:hypothetical protein